MSKFGVPTDAQLQKINKLAKRTLSKDEVFVFPSKLAGDMIIPDRYIQLTKELLEVFAKDAKNGVSLLLDHSWAPDGFFGIGGRPKMAIPYGRTFDSRFKGGEEEGETTSLVAEHYMVRDIEIDGIKTNDLIASIEAGTLFDTSIGFSYSKAVCSVCDDNYYNCNHYRGREYEIELDNGETEIRLCYIKAKPPGFLMENSLVFDGAYPGAGVLSKVGDIIENETGIYQVVDELKDIDPNKELIATYSQRTGLITMVKKANHKKIYHVGDIANVTTNTAQNVGNSIKTIMKGVENKMNENVLKFLESFGIEASEDDKPNEILEQLAEKWNKVIAALKAKDTTLSIGEDEVIIELPKSILDNAEVYMTQEQVTEELGSELSADEVLKLAKEGQEYRKALSDEAIAMGVRAMGNDFPKETWENSFRTMGIQAIKDIMKTWELQAQATIPAGRKTDPAAGQKQSRSIPDDAFKVGK